MVYLLILSLSLVLMLNGCNNKVVDTQKPIESVEPTEGEKPVESEKPAEGENAVEGEKDVEPMESVEPIIDAEVIEETEVEEVKEVEVKSERSEIIVEQLKRLESISINTKKGIKQAKTSITESVLDEKEVYKRIKEFNKESKVYLRLPIKNQDEGFLVYLNIESGGYEPNAYVSNDDLGNYTETLYEVPEVNMVKVGKDKYMCYIVSRIGARPFKVNFGVKGENVMSFDVN